MKKISALLLSLVMAALALSACGQDKTAQDSKTDSGSASSSEKTLTMATNAEFKPFEYLEGEKIVGADVDLAEAIAKELGCKLEITNIDFDAALTGAATGKYDVAIAGITANEDRKKNMAFSDDYYKASQAIIVAEGSDIKSAKDLEGKTVSCQEGTTGEQYLLDNEYKVQSFKTGSEAVSALTSGKVDAVVIDNAVATALSAEQNGKTAVLDEALTEETYAIATKLGNTELVDKLNKAIAKLKEDGTLNEIFKKYDLPVDAE